MSDSGDLVKKLVFETIVTAAMKRIIVALPFLGFPVINPIFVFFFMKVASIIFDELHLRADLVLIDIKTEHQKRKYEEAVTELKKAQETPIPNVKELDNARENFKNRLHDLIRFDP